METLFQSQTWSHYSWMGMDCHTPIYDHFADGIFKSIFLDENIWILIKISLKKIPKGPINSISALVQIMTWHWPGVNPSSVPMMVSLLTHTWHHSASMFSHHRDVTWAVRHLQSLAIQMIVQQLVQAYKRKYIKASHYQPFVGGNPAVTVGFSSHKRLKSLKFHDIMTSIHLILQEIIPMSQHHHDKSPPIFRPWPAEFTLSPSVP